MKTDQELQNDVLAELRWEPQVTATHIGVSVEGGIVTLSGHVPTYLEKHHAERAAKRVQGVRAVADELEVRLHGSLHRSDADIAAACVEALAGHVAVPDDKVSVVVRGGSVTLEGEVEWGYQREAALAAVRCLAGVVSVRNAITVAPRAAAGDIKASIEAAFRRHAELDAQMIHVQTFDRKVVLSGRARSWAEREDAQDAAWAAPGVVAVDNHITVDV